MWIPCFIPLYSPLNLYLSILWILDFKYILLLLLLLLSVYIIRFIGSKVRFIHTNTVPRSHSCSEKNYAYA